MSDNIQILNALFPDEERPEISTDLNKLEPLENVDELVLIIDRSGSMRGIKTDAEGGINSFIEEQKEGGEANITVAEFDDTYTELYSRIPIVNAPEYVLRPRGMTALFDAVGKTLQTYRDVETTGKKIAVIVTDGHENASQEWRDPNAVKELIEELRNEGWEFVFLAADEEAVSSSTSWGMQIDTSMVFDRTQADSQNAAYDAIATYTTSLRSGKSRAAAIADMDDKIDNFASIKKLSS